MTKREIDDIITDVSEVEVVVAHKDRVTLCVDGVFLKVDADQSKTDVEVDAMRRAPVPTASILWRKPPVLALAALPGTELAKMGKPSRSPPAAWAAAGRVIRVLHDAPAPPWRGRTLDELAAELDRECAWLTANDVVPPGVVEYNRALAETALRQWRPAFVHGDLQPSHVFVADNEVTGILDWSEAAPGDPLYDLATVTMGHPEHLQDVVAGYGADVDHDLIRAWWSLRSLRGIRWLLAHGFDPTVPGCEIQALIDLAHGKR